MDEEKINIILNKFTEVIPNCRIRYLFEKDFHKFRIELTEVTHWLYLRREYISDHEAIVLLNMINIYHLGDLFSNTNHPRWIYLDTNGLHDVDENFTK